MFKVVKLYPSQATFQYNKNATFDSLLDEFDILI